MVVDREEDDVALADDAPDVGFVEALRGFRGLLPGCSSVIPVGGDVTTGVGAGESMSAGSERRRAIDPDQGRRTTERTSRDDPDRAGARMRTGGGRPGSQVGSSIAKGACPFAAMRSSSSSWPGSFARALVGRGTR
jgi:hypothetical protein